MTQRDSDMLSGTRVLVVEDEYYLADDLSRTLVEAGAEIVGPVATLADAQRKVREGGFDCAILDMNLRGDFAFPIAQALSEAAVPFVVATGYNQESLPEAVRDAPRVEKPFTPADVVATLARLRSLNLS